MHSNHHTITRRLPATLTLLTILLITITFPTPQAAPQPELTIYLFEANTPSWEPLSEPIFYEHNTYDIAITEQTNVTFAYNVTITIGTTDETYCTSPSLPYITITAPTYTTNTQEILITATKEGYTPATTIITLLRGTLTLTTDRINVQEDESFSVTVTNQYNQPIPDCLIYLDQISSDTATALTNQNGIAYITAPTVKENHELNVIAVKDGYAAALSQIRIENLDNTYLGDINTELTDILPVIFAILSVIGAILYVTIRNRQNHNTPEFKIHHHPPPQNYQRPHYQTPRKQPLSSKRYTPPSRPPLPTRPTKNHQEPPPSTNSPPITPVKRSPHIEEIRIHIEKQQQKNPTSTKKESSQQKINNIIPRHKKSQYDWFHGTDDIRTKIDSLTAKVDGKKADDWFEGIEEIRCKVDEKVKKKHKKTEEIIH